MPTVIFEGTTNGSDVGSLSIPDGNGLVELPKGVQVEVSKDVAKRAEGTPYHKVTIVEAPKAADQKAAA